MAEGPVPDFTRPILESGVSYAKLIVDAPPPKRTKLTWTFQDTDNSELIRFRERFALDRVIEGARDEWHALLLLRNWIYQQNPRGGNELSTLAGYAQAEGLLLAINAGGEYWCTFFAILTQTVMQTMGFPARHLGVSCEYDRFNRSSHHGVCEVWVNSLKKWVLFDSHFNAHYTLDGVVLNAYEIHRAALAGRAAEVSAHKGADGLAMAESGRLGNSAIDTEADTYFWRYYVLKNTPFSVGGSWDNSQMALLTDASHDGVTWWQNNRVKHVGYQGGFIETRNVSDVYFDLNRVYLEPQIKKHQPGLVVFDVGTFTPNFDKLEVRLDGGAWQPQSTWTRVQWWLHPGDNTYEVRTLNKLGRHGPVTKLQCNGVKHPAVKSASMALAAPHTV